MSNNSIPIKTINDLLKYNFFIPSYQRGYRWTKQQVTDLLNDIWEFINKQNEKDNEWYCLQPVVVMKRVENTEIENKLFGDWYDVIDGQQRLTTILLILKNLEHFVESERKNFEIQYETRKNNENFLTKIDSKSEYDSKKNVDYFHIYNAYTTIKTWFQKKANDGQTSISSKFITPFLEKVKIIWYETTDSKSIDIFTRINSGKIPLTNAELIKALFLNSSNFPNADKVKLGLIQREIASEWDRIEYALQDDSFWYFINKNENNLATRIEFIFNLMSDTPSDDKYSTFYFFNEKFKTKSEKEVTNNWQEIKKYFQTLKEWYNDRELYHKIGYLIAVGTDIKTILENKENKLKSEFGKWIDHEIEKIVIKKQVDELEYGQDNGQLIKVLLLHNIITTLNSDDTSLRFPFNKYKNKKNGGWSLEHIHAQNSDDITEIDDFEEWLKILDTDILTEEIKNEINNFNNDKQKEKVSSLVDKISNLFGESDIHSIENMALLSKNDNSKLNNGLFPVKRERIIKLEKNGAFIPLATKKIFQKYFENCTKQLSKWEEKDRNAYLNDIKKTLKKYLPQTEISENEQ
ncbi:MAG: DUF262 domain-containing protein [Chitinophagales bacterium]|nr:DUF262 domain-containing protein [Chitinophagales bacterium]